MLLSELRHVNTHKVHLPLLQEMLGDNLSSLSLPRAGRTTEHERPQRLTFAGHSRHGDRDLSDDRIQSLLLPDDAAREGCLEVVEAVELQWLALLSLLHVLTAVGVATKECSERDQSLVLTVLKDVTVLLDDVLSEPLDGDTAIGFTDALRFGHDYGASNVSENVAPLPERHVQDFPLPVLLDHGVIAHDTTNEAVDDSVINLVCRVHVDGLTPERRLNQQACLLCGQ